MKRVAWIDIAKGLGIVLFILAHTRFPTKEMTGLWPYFVDTALVALFFYALGHFCRDAVQRILTLPRMERWSLLVWAAVAVIDAALLIVYYRYKATFVSRDLKDPAFYFLLAALGTIVILAFHNFLGLCRSSWHMNSILSQALEFMILGLLLWLLSGPLHILISPHNRK